ncbi:MAG: sigma-70 family RNA polymerase sigma factor [Candidatus Sulfotelmatobacter sp.]
MSERSPEPIRDPIRELLDSLYRVDSGRILATLIRLLGDFDLAEEAMHEAFAAALSVWPTSGVPDNPRPWLISTARFKAIDTLRRRARFDASRDELVRYLEAQWTSAERSNTGDNNNEDELGLEDDRLRLIFTCCHPSLALEARVALTLREVCGLTTEEIAKAFLITPRTLAQRIVRAKAKIRETPKRRATTDAIDYRQMKPALERCETTLGRKPKQIVADGDYTNHASVQTAADHGVDFYGSWQNSWRAVERDAHGRHSEFLASAFPYDAAQDRVTCPAGQTLTHHALLNRDNGVRTHVYRAPKRACPSCLLRDKCAPQQARPDWRRSITRLQEPSATTAFKQKMATEEAKQIYARRSPIAEFPHAWIKQRCGLRQFRCRGRLKASMEAMWACLSYNIIRWFRLRSSPHP